MKVNKIENFKPIQAQFLGDLKKHFPDFYSEDEVITIINRIKLLRIFNMYIFKDEAIVSTLQWMHKDFSYEKLRYIGVIEKLGRLRKEGNEPAKFIMGDDFGMTPKPMFGTMTRTF